jgi:hypothetical protein
MGRRDLGGPVVPGDPLKSSCPRGWKYLAALAVSAAMWVAIIELIGALL